MEGGGSAAWRYDSKRGGNRKSKQETFWRHTQRLCQSLTLNLGRITRKPWRTGPMNQTEREATKTRMERWVGQAEKPALSWIKIFLPSKSIELRVAGGSGGGMRPIAFRREWEMLWRNVCAKCVRTTEKEEDTIKSGEDKEIQGRGHERNRERVFTHIPFFFSLIGAWKLLIPSKSSETSNPRFKSINITPNRYQRNGLLSQLSVHFRPLLSLSLTSFSHNGHNETKTKLAVRTFKIAVIQSSALNLAWNAWLNLATTVHFLYYFPKRFLITFCELSWKNSHYFQPFMPLIACAAAACNRSKRYFSLEKLRP